MEHVIQLEAGALLADRYNIVKRLGGGGMGSVYLARDKRLADAYRAVKEMIGTYADEAQRKKATEDFERESQLLASLDHPAIPTVYDYFTSSGCYYLVMKYISAGDLSQRLKSAPEGFLDEKMVVEWGIQIADVLAYLHSQEPPIIYRDMKPANIMLDEKDRIVLVDFGIARFVAPTQKNVTAIGTMGYAPPELFAGKVEPRSDIYSLGATMFHLLTGRDPQDNPLLLFDFSRNPRPKQINPKLSEQIDLILAKSVEHKPTNRFASAAEMKKALEEHLKKLVGGGSSAASSSSDEVAFCGQCGHKVPVDNKFCPNCGAPQLSGPVPALVFYGDGQPVILNIIKDQNLVGRLDTNRGIFPDIDLTPFDKDGKVSRRHAIVHRNGDKILVEDLGSTNGTFVNGADRLTPKQPQLLKPGDEVRFGDTVILRFFVGEVPAVAPPSVTAQTPVVGASAGSQKVPSPPPPGFEPKLPNVRSSNPADTTKSATPDVKASGKAADGKPATFTARFMTDISFAKKVKLGDTVTLSVGLMTAGDPGGGGAKVAPAKMHPHDKEVSVTLPKTDPPPEDVLLDVYVAAPGFEIEPDIFARINTPIRRDAPAKTFQLKAVQAGTTKLTIDFYRDSDPLNSVSIETVVEG